MIAAAGKTAIAVRWRRNPRQPFGSERGLTTIELMVAIVIGIIVILASDALLDTSATLTGNVQDRVDSSQRARLAMDQISRELRSQVCPSPGSASVAAADGSSVTFYTYVGPGTSPTPEKHTIAYSSSSNTIVESDYVNQATWPNMSWPAQPTRTRTLLENIVPEAAAPVFSYYAFPSGAGAVAPSVQLATPLTAATAPLVARISIAFVARANSRQDTARSTDLEDDVYLPTWNANSPSGPVPPPCL